LLKDQNHLTFLTSTIKIYKTMNFHKKMPKQDRSKVTLDSIYKNLAQIVEMDGLDGLTMQKIADEAGFSVGTLYQYFPNKQAITASLGAWGQRLLVAKAEEFLSHIESFPGVSEVYLPDLLRVYVSQVMRLFASDSVMVRIALRLCWSLEQPKVTIEASKIVSDRLLICIQRIKHPDLEEPSAAQMFVLVRSVVGVLRYAVLEGSALLGSDELEQQLNRMIWGMLGKQSATAGRRLTSEEILGSMQQNPTAP
jgi:AcrR family transcriptional regulator